ncbi:MAG: hypothetical protein KKB51_17885 [Candidatus Riflebacteria bacterium]|nr:hypothetical protein [Candidatus Riflebacteria bacterium]
MILYYCMGGGFGHITRFTAFCRQHRIRPALITNCEQVISGKIAVDAERILMPDTKHTASKESLMTWVGEAISSCRPEKLLVDAFPGGVLGELCSLDQLQNIECEYLARILDIPTYQKRLSGNLPKFSKIHRLEKLSNDHENWLENMQAPIENTDLHYDSGQLRKPQLPANCWLIIHSGNNDELEQLWLFARQTADIEMATAEFAMVSPGQRPDFLPPEVAHFDIYPADALFQQASRVFSAAGFNIMKQMQQCPTKHHVLPMPRVLDDQFLRHRFWLESSAE